MPRDYNPRYLGSDEEIAAVILADINYRKLPYENALRITAVHVRRIRDAAYDQAKGWAVPDA